MGNIVSWFLSLAGNLLSSLTTTGGTFVSYASTGMIPIAVILFVMFGLKSVQVVESGGTVSFTGLGMLCAKIVLCLSVIAGWMVPIPWLGVSAGTFIPNGGLELARMIGYSGAQVTAQSMATWAGMESPLSILSLGWIWWFMAEVLLAIDGIALLIMLAGPLIIEGALIIVGPVMVAFWAVPELTGIARGYLRCLITYSIVPMVGAAVLDETASVLLPSIGTAGGMAVPLENILPNAALICVALAVSILTQLFVIRIASHIASGSAGTGNEWVTAGLAAVGARL